MIHYKTIWWVLTSAVALSTMNAATAQDVSELQEITVTAQKRVENINKIGMQVTAIAGDALASQNITTPADFANVVPSLSYTTTEYNTPVYTLRGVGFYDASLSASPTVSVYMDEVSLPFSALTKHAFFDLQRVEVLKGPQGTLYGQNATGGAINYISKKPTDTFQAGVDVGYGNFNRYNGEAYVSGPLTSKLNARLSGRFERGDDWQRSTVRPGDELGAMNNSMIRLILDYAATDRLRLQFNLNGWKDKTDPQAAQYAFSVPQFVGFVAPSVLAQPFTPRNARDAEWSPGSPHADNNFWQVSLRADFKVADDMSLISISSYDRYRQHQGEDYDGLAARTKDLPEDDGDVKSINQEFRLAIDTIKNQRLVLGANYEDSKVYENILSSYRDTSAANFFATFGFPVSTVFYSTDQTMKTYAGFANWEWDIRDVTLRAGARYTGTKRTAKSCEYDPSGIPTNTGEFFYAVVFGGAFGHSPGGDQCLAGNNLGRVVNGVAPGSPGEYASELKENNLSYRVGLDWRVSETLLAYANVAKGYKAGGFPSVAASAFTQYEPVTQESLLAFDVGFKDSLFNRRLQVNGAAFYYRYTDKQILARLIDPVFGVLAVLQNIPKSSIKGGELEVVALPFTGMTLAANYTYLRATIDEFQGINGVGIAGNFGGSPVPFTPKNQASLSADYEMPVFSGWKASVGASLNYRGSTISVVGGEQNIPPPAGPQGSRMLGIDSYALIDLRAGLRTSNDRWKVQLWAKNVTNKFYWNNAVLAYDDISRFAGMPRTYGIILGHTF